MKGNGMDVGFAAVLEAPRPQPERVAYTVHEAAAMMGVHYFSVYWLIQRGKLHVCHALPGKLLIPRSEILRLLNVE